MGVEGLLTGSKRRPQAVRLPFEIFGHPHSRQIVALPAHSANSLYHLASSRSLSASAKPVRSLSCICVSPTRPSQVGVLPAFPYRSEHGAIADVPATGGSSPTARSALDYRLTEVGV